MYHRSMFWVAAAALCFMLLAPSALEATHFRFGVIEWKTTAVTNQVEIKLRLAYRANYPGFPVNVQVGQTIQADGTLLFGDGSQTANFTMNVVARSNAENWIIVEQVFLKTYTNSTPRLVRFTGCCRISTLFNGPDTDYNIQTTVVPNSNNASPRSLVVPVVVVAPGAASTFTLPAIDPNNDNIRFRLASPADAGGRANVPGLTINQNTGMLTWNNTGLPTTPFYTTQVIIEDLTAGGLVKTQTPVDFLLRIGVPVGTPPVLTLNPSGVQKVNVGQLLTYTITATDADPGAVLSLEHTALPAGSTQPAVTPGGSPRSTTFSWTPSAGQEGSYIIGYVTVDEHGQQAIAFKTLVVNRPPTAEAGTAQTLECAGGTTEVTLSGSGSDPDNDPLTYTWMLGATELATGANPTVNLPLGEHVITLVVSDGTAQTSDNVTITIEDTEAPVPDLASLEDVTGECSATITSAPTATDQCGGVIAGTTTDDLTYDQQGSYVVTWTFDDGNGNTSTQTQNVIVDDVTPPGIVLNANVTLWPPNQQYATFTLEQMVASTSDNCEVTGMWIVGAVSDEAEDAAGTGDGETLNDIVIPDCSTVQVRRERSGALNGRVYTVTIAVQDIGGNITTADYLISVPRNVNGTAVKDAGMYSVSSGCPAPPKRAPQTGVPAGMTLAQNYPNPFNPSTVISYTVPEHGAVRLSILSPSGEVVATLVDGMVRAGSHAVTFTASDLASGIYFARLDYQGASLVRTLHLTK